MGESVRFFDWLYAWLQDAAKVIAELSGISGLPDAAAIRSALFKSHPDHGGTAALFHRVQQARKILEGSL